MRDNKVFTDIYNMYLGIDNGVEHLLNTFHNERRSRIFEDWFIALGEVLDEE